MSRQKVMIVAEAILINNVTNRFIFCFVLAVKHVVFWFRRQNYCVKLLKLVSVMKKMQKNAKLLVILVMLVQLVILAIFVFLGVV